MGRFKVKVTYEAYFSPNDQRRILSEIFTGSRCISAINTYGNNDSAVDIVMRGGKIEIIFIDNTTNRFQTWHLYTGILRFCTINKVHPQDIMNIISPEVADQILQYAVFNKIKYQ